MGWLCTIQIYYQQHNKKLSPSITIFTYHIFLQVSWFLCLLESYTGRPKERVRPNPWCHWVLLLRIMNFISSMEQSTSTPYSTGHKLSLHYFYSKSKVCITTTGKEQKQRALQNALYT